MPFKYDTPQGWRGYLQQRLPARFNRARGRSVTVTGLAGYSGCGVLRRPHRISPAPWKAQMTDDRDWLRQYDKDSAGRRVLVGLSAKETRVWDFLSGKDLAGQLTVEEQRLYEFLLAKHDRARAGRWDK